MTNETKPSTRTDVIGAVAVFLAVTLVLAVPVSRVLIFDSVGAMWDWFGTLPGAIFAGVVNVWNSIF